MYRLVLYSILHDLHLAIPCVPIFISSYTITYKLN